MASPEGPQGTQTVLTGWGRTAPTCALVVQPGDAAELFAALMDAREKGTGALARGLGRSYGDAAQLGGGTVVDMTGLSGVVAEDLQEGIVTVKAGTSLDRLMRRYVPRGWFVPVSPGTRFVTVGGAIASDVHGKNHHRDGSFGLHVINMTLLTGRGPVSCGPVGPRSELFWATVGGMGLTGIIEEATLQMIPVETSKMVVTTQRCRDIDDLMATMSESDHLFRYSVAWIDCLARGSALGRSVLTRGDHARETHLPDKGSLFRHSRKANKRFAPLQLLSAPRSVPRGLVNHWTISAFNEAWYRRAPVLPETTVESLASFFHPLDGVGNWNRLYGPRGFLQYQLLLPFGAEPELRHILESLSASRASSFLAVLKRFGPGNSAPLSFPDAGWTLALDLPARDGAVAALLDGFDELVARAEGRVYLAKDSRLRPELLPAMYPEVERWRKVRDEADPDRIFVSDLARRLHLL